MRETILHSTEYRSYIVHLRLIGDIERQIKEQEELIAAYQSESAARLEVFSEAFTALEKVAEVIKVEPGRSTADLAALDKIISSSKDDALVAASSSSRVGSPSLVASGKTLDPKASVFTPGGRPNMPNSTASSPVLPAQGTTSRPASNARKDKSGAGNKSRAATPGVAASKAASGSRDRSGKDAGKKAVAAAAAAGRARSPLAGNVITAGKESGALRGGRRQANNVPSQLGKSSTMNMEDGEISSNPSEAGEPGQHKGKDGKAVGENGGGNKRGRQEEEGEAVKRRRVGEGKDGVAGV